MAAAKQPPTVGDLTCKLTVAYVSHNFVLPSQLPALIRAVEKSLLRCLTDWRNVSELVDSLYSKRIADSIRSDFLISFIDGKPYKTLKRHLFNHGLSPASYRSRYNLPENYPMVALSYSHRRSAIALNMAFGKSSHYRGRKAKSALGLETSRAIR